MNNAEDKKMDVGDVEKVKEISKWTERYAKNRTLTFMVWMVAFFTLFYGFKLFAYFGGQAYESENMILFWVCVFLGVSSLLGILFFSVPKWGNKFTKFITGRLYRHEGEVVFGRGKQTKKHKAIGMVVAGMFGGCILLSVVCGNVFNWPMKYMQPISAIYLIPFLVFLGIWQRSVAKPAGFLWWLWPVLYGVHAILIVAGVPIVFEGRWTGLNMLIPVAGYGLLCGLAGHLYSRYALRKLKAAARLQEGE